MFRKGEPQLTAVVERTFRKLGSNRDLVPLYNKWFVARLPTGEKLGVAISPQLEEAFKVLDDTQGTQQLADSRFCFAASTAFVRKNSGPAARPPPATTAYSMRQEQSAGHIYFPMRETASSWLTLTASSMVAAMRAAACRIGLAQPRRRCVPRLRPCGAPCADDRVERRRQRA